MALLVAFARVFPEQGECLARAARCDEGVGGQRAMVRELMCSDAARDSGGHSEAVVRAYRDYMEAVVAGAEDLEPLITAACALDKVLSTEKRTALTA